MKFLWSCIINFDKKSENTVNMAYIIMVWRKFINKDCLVVFWVQPLIWTMKNWNVIITKGFNWFHSLWVIRWQSHTKTSNWTITLTSKMTSTRGAEGQLFLTVHYTLYCWGKNKFTKLILHRGEQGTKTNV